MDKILIIEDNKDVNLLLSETLEQEGYIIKSIFDGFSAINTIKNDKFSLILLDIMLPYKSGDEILKDIRKFSDVPVIIISAKDMISTKIDLLKLGADDYITKPFDLGEVAARVESQLRRVKGNNNRKENKLTYKDMEIDIDNKIAHVNNIELNLTAKEFFILQLFLENKNKVFSKANIYETVWEEEYLGDDNAIKTHMSNLRNKLKKANPDEEYIETIWGLGYRLKSE